MDYYVLIIMFISTDSLYIQYIPYCRLLNNPAADALEKEISL